MGAPTPGGPSGPTPSQTIGPFFHDALIEGGGGVLVEDGVRGIRIEITGQVLDGDGHPVDDALVEIWQPDASGVFAHPDDPDADAADPHFRGFGRSDTAAEGRYGFETIKPGRPRAAGDADHAPFINVRVFARGLLRDVVTRLYFSDDVLDADPVLERIDPRRRHTLIANLESTDGVLRYRFDIRLQGQDETVFFEVGGGP